MKPCMEPSGFQPLIFQADVARISFDLIKAQAGNYKLASMMNEKQLKVHPDKTRFITIGNKKFQERVAKETMEFPIMFRDIVTRCKVAGK